MHWSYTGGGDWELQGGLVLGCIYGSKFTDSVKCTLEWKNMKGETQQELLFEGTMELDKAKKVVEVGIKDLLRRELESMNRIYY